MISATRIFFCLIKNVPICNGSGQKSTNHGIAISSYFEQNTAQTCDIIWNTVLRIEKKNQTNKEFNL